MRYWEPTLRLDSHRRGKADKLGGRPWGLPESRWPTCTKCGWELALIAQLEHHDDRLDLGRAGRVLFVFQCNRDPGTCETWDATSGANDAFVIEPEESTASWTQAPTEVMEEQEVIVSGWSESDDGIDEKHAAAFYDDTKRFALPEEIQRLPVMTTRIGSVPSLIQSADELPKDPWRFVMQLDSTHSLSDGTSIEGFNFGDAGIGYVFVRDREGKPPEVRFLWQCG
jgi:hypothetical protein